jgi:hypothetical protein
MLPRAFWLFAWLGTACTSASSSAPPGAIQYEAGPGTCPTSADQGQPCDSAGSCTGCSQGAGFSCICPAPDAGFATSADGGRVWTCIGTGSACP